MSAIGTLWRGLACALAALEGVGAVILQGEDRGQDKGRQCAMPFCPGRSLDSQGFWPLLRNARAKRAMCGARRTPGAIRVFRTLRSAAP